MDKTEERPVTFYIFKSLSESLPSIYISKKSISLSSKNIHSTLIKSKKKSHWNHPTRLNAFPSMDPQIASEFCIRDLAPVCKCAINHGSICSSAKGHTAWVTMKLLIPRRPFFLSYLLPISLSLSLCPTSGTARRLIFHALAGSGAEKMGRARPQAARRAVKRVAEKGWPAAWSYEAPSGRNNQTTRGVI